MGGAYPATGRMERHVVEDVSEGPLWLNDENYSVITYLPWTKSSGHAASMTSFFLFKSMKPKRSGRKRNLKHRWDRLHTE